MALERLRTPSLSGSDTEEVEETEAEEDTDEEQESSGSRFGTLKKTVGIVLAAVIAIVTLRKLRNRGSDDE